MQGKRTIPKVLLIAVLSGLFCVATLAIAPAGEVDAACGRAGWYFAEGYTGGDFDTWILIQNPNETDAIAHLRFFTPNGEPIAWDVPLAGETRQSVYLNSVPGLENQEVATEVICEGNGVIAERAMYFNYDTGQGDRVGGHATIGAPNLSCCWYLPEGYTGGGFDTYVLLMNPNEQEAKAHIKLMKPLDGRYYLFETTIPAGRRKTVKLDELVWTEGQDNFIPATGEGEGEEPLVVTFDNTDVSTYIYADKPIVAERAMYFDYYGKAGGSASIGATCTATEWYLPEGYTGGDFDTWVMAMNPSGYTVDITYTFYSNAPGSEPVSVVHPNVGPWSRDTIHVDDVPGLEGTDVSTKVTATRPVQLAEETQDPVKRYAVLVGVEDYPTGDGYLYTEDDVVDIKHKLAEQGAFTYDYCLGENATLENLQKKMDWLADVADANDIVAFFFAGRSSVATENQIDLYDGSVTSSELDAYFAALQSEKVLAMFSCDDSGELATDLAGPGRIVMASCAKGETSYEFADADFTAASGDYGNGAWAHYFVEALGKEAADTNGDKLISAEETHKYLKDRVSNLVFDKEGADQNPQFEDQIEGQLDLTVDRVPTGIVAERSMFFNYGSANDGATSIGACSTYPNWFLAEGYTGGGFDTFVLVMNPYDYWQKLTVTFMTPSGEPIVEEYTCPPNYRYTIKVDDVPGLEAMDVSTHVCAQPMEVAAACEGSGVVVERAMYFTYVDPVDKSVKTGGSSSIGYGSW